MNSTPIETFPQRKRRKNERSIFPDNRHFSLYCRVGTRSSRTGLETTWRDIDGRHAVLFDGTRSPVRDHADEYSGQLALNRYISVPE